MDFKAMFGMRTTEVQADEVAGTEHVVEATEVVMVEGEAHDAEQGGPVTCTPAVDEDGALEPVELTKEDHAVINAAVNTIGPVAMRFGFGGFVGFCSGYAIKKATKVAALTLGVGFVCLQSLQYAGYIEIKWTKIRQDMVRRIDSDGSGSVGVKDLRHYITKLVSVLRFHGPPAAGFSTGLYLGFLEG